jgi:hypothetical protein
MRNCFQAGICSVKLLLKNQLYVTFSFQMHLIAEIIKIEANENNEIFCSNAGPHPGYAGSFR